VAGRRRSPLSYHRSRGVRQVPVDAYRRGNEFKIDLDLPGADPGSIDLTVERDVLTVRATRTPHRDQGDEIQVAERPQGQFSR
jgi:HSP20 family protein